MDAPEDKDLKLQRASADLLSDLETSLPRFVYSSKAIHRVEGETRLRPVREHVTLGKTQDLINLLEPFQEWPQLLDTHLSTIITPLVNAFLGYISQHRAKYHVFRGDPAFADVPLPRAICQLLYTLCKIRGSKTISRFFDNQPKYLDPLLNAFLDWRQGVSSGDSSRVPDVRLMVWEERYVMLLWLSHLMLTPFDLASIVSDGTCSFDAQDALTNVELPSRLPLVASTLIAISAEHIISPSKERDAAKELLVRLALRPDMRSIGLPESLVGWSISSLEQNSDIISKSIYAPIGLMSFVAGLIGSADSVTIMPSLVPIFKLTQKIRAEAASSESDIMSSALARKMMVKTLRAITAKVLETEFSASSSYPFLDAGSIIEDVVDHLLNDLADKDTPVRLASSKAISVIASKLSVSMRAEVNEAILGSLQEDVLWPASDTVASLGLGRRGSRLEAPDLTAVNPLRWHGLVLTLSHLLFRGSPPPQQLPEILNAIILALKFQQRTSVGSSMGTNVRDGACFGIWAIARRYSTNDISNVDPVNIRTAQKDQTSSTLQILANELVAAASLDPSGNIRRGASAALQEMIGRHPDVIIYGIPLVQIVDYHAVALRSHAIVEVAVGAARLDEIYWAVVFEGLLGWRGVASSDAESRRQAAAAIGLLALANGANDIERSVALLQGRIETLKDREVEEKHGLVLALVALIKTIVSSPQISLSNCAINKLSSLWETLRLGFLFHDNDFTSFALRPQLNIEAACSMISALSSMSLGMKESKNFVLQSPSVLSSCIQILKLSLGHADSQITAISSMAAQSFFQILDEKVKEDLVKDWLAVLSSENGRRPRASHVSSYLAALGTVFRHMKDASFLREAIIQTLVSYTANETEIEAKVAAMRSLVAGVLVSSVNEDIILAILRCLDDFTIDQRGDVGSLVRVEAVAAVETIWQQRLLVTPEMRRPLAAKVAGLAVEKLDKVRSRAWTCLRKIWSEFGLSLIVDKDFTDVAQASTVEYYYQVATLLSVDWTRLALLEGYVTSAGVGAESILRSSRTAILASIEQMSDAALAVFLETIPAIIRRNENQERTIVPVLEVVAFLLDAGVFDRVNKGEFDSRNLFALVQRVHYKTGNVRKLKVAVDVYTGLAMLTPTCPGVISKLVAMLLHPYSAIRNAAADALFLIIEDDQLKQTDWSLPRNVLRPKLPNILEQLKLQQII